MPVHRTPWRDFPNVFIHSTLVALRAHPFYPAAKEGDLRAARVVVRDLFRPTLMIPKADFIAPVVQLDVNERWNALPMAFAVRLAEHLDARVIPTIVQSNVVHHTAADALHRLLHQPTFTGKVPCGTYTIVDDVVTLGSTLANLRGHIERQGGEVAAATTLAAGIFAARIAPDPSLISTLKLRFRHDLALIPEKLGFPAECLTSREAHYVRGLANLVALRDPLAPRQSRCQSAL